SEDDWSFIIKAHALIDAVLTHMLVAAVRKEELRNRFAKMGLREKLRFATDLKLITRRELACIEALSDIRNLLAHDVTYAQFRVDEWVKALPPDQHERFALKFQPYRPVDDDAVFDLVKGVETSWRKFYTTLFRAAPKGVILTGVIQIVAVLFE